MTDEQPDKPAKHAGGRPSKLTPELARRICDLVRAGNYLETAAAAAGIGHDTIRDWLRKGARARSGPHHDFAEAFARADAEAEARHVTLISTAAR